MAMSIILNPPTQLDYFLSQLKSTLLQDSAWRAPCYGLKNKEGFDSKLYGKISKTIYKLAKGHQNLDSPIRSFHKDSRYLRNPGIEVQITSGEGLYQVEYPGVNEKGEMAMVRIQVPQEIANIFAWLENQNEPFKVRECLKNFPEVSPTDLNELFNRMVKTGLLKMLWFVEI